jgi:hypothetical protein
MIKETTIHTGQKIPPLQKKDSRHLLQRALANVVLACCQSLLNLKVKVTVMDGTGKRWHIDSTVIINDGSITVILPFKINQSDLL